MALFLVISFTLMESAGYAQIQTIDRTRLPARQGLQPTDELQVSIPAELGSIEEAYQAPCSMPQASTGSLQPTTCSQKLVIYIQDAHDSLEAQENIAKIITHLVEEENVKTVYEEGYEGVVPTDQYFGFIQDKDLRKKTADFFMDKLRIGGAEYAHINRTKNFSLIGADNLNLHKKNIQAYRKAFRHKKQTDEDLHLVMKEIKQLIQAYFPKPLKEWAGLKERFNSRQIDLLDYLKRSAALLEKADSAGLKRFPIIREILQAENTPAHFQKPEDIQKISATALYKEIGEFEHEIAGAFLRNERDGSIYRYYQAIQLLKRLSDLSLSQPEYQTVKDVLAQIRTQEVADFIARQSGKSLVLSSRWEVFIRQNMEFYEAAGLRDEAVEKRLKDFLNGPESTAVLVFGGFHKSRIKEILTRHSISYQIVSPRITGLDSRHHDYYKHLMAKGYYAFETPALLSKASRPLAVFALNGGDRTVKSVYRVIENFQGDRKNLTLTGIENQLLRSEVRPAVSEFSDVEILKISRDPEVKKLWDRQVRIHLRLFKFAQKLQRLSAEQGSLINFSPEDLKDLMRTVYTPGSKEWFRYQIGFITLSAGVKNLDTNVSRKFKINLLFLAAFRQTHVNPLEFISQNKEAFERLMRDSYLLEKINARIGLNPAYDGEWDLLKTYLARMKEGEKLIKTFHELLYDIFPKPRIGFHQIAQKKFAKPYFKFHMLPGYETLLPDNFLNEPQKYLFSPDGTLDAATLAGKIYYDDWYGPALPDDIPGEVNMANKVRKMTLRDGQEVYIKRVNLLRSGSPEDEILVAERVNRALQDQSPHFHAQKFIGIFLYRGSFYLMSLGVPVSDKVEIEEDIYQQIESVLREQNVQDPEGAVRRREILPSIESDGSTHYTVVDFETHPFRRALTAAARSETRSGLSDPFLLEQPAKLKTAEAKPVSEERAREFALALERIYSIIDKPEHKSLRPFAGNLIRKLVKPNSGIPPQRLPLDVLSLADQIHEDFPDIVPFAQARSIFADWVQVQPENDAILLMGDSGHGKGSLAYALHKLDPEKYQIAGEDGVILIHIPGHFLAASASWSPNYRGRAFGEKLPVEKVFSVGRIKTVIQLTRFNRNWLRLNQGEENSILSFRNTIATNRNIPALFPGFQAYLPLQSLPSVLMVQHTLTSPDKYEALAEKIQKTIPVKQLESSPRAELRSAAQKLEIPGYKSIPVEDGEQVARELNRAAEIRFQNGETSFDEFSAIGYGLHLVSVSYVARGTIKIVTLDLSDFDKAVGKVQKIFTDLAQARSETRPFSESLVHNLLITLVVRNMPVEYQRTVRGEILDIVRTYKKESKIYLDKLKANPDGNFYGYLSRIYKNHEVVPVLEELLKEAAIQRRSELRSSAAEDAAERHDSQIKQNFLQVYLEGNAEIFREMAHEFESNNISWVIVGPGTERDAEWQGERPRVFDHQETADIYQSLIGDMKISPLSQQRVMKSLKALIVGIPLGESGILFSKKFDRKGAPYMALFLAREYSNARPLLYFMLSEYVESMSSYSSGIEVRIPLDVEAPSEPVVQMLQGGSYSQVSRIIKPDGTSYIQKETDPRKDGGKLLAEAQYMQTFQRSGNSSVSWFPEIYSIQDQKDKTSVQMEDIPWPNLSGVMRAPTLTPGYPGGQKTPMGAAVYIYKRLTPDFYSKQQSPTPPDFLDKYHFEKLEKRWSEAAGTSPVFKKLLETPFIKIVPMFDEGNRQFRPNLKTMKNLLMLITKARPDLFTPPYLSKQHGDLHFGNILVDPFHYVLTGKIDRLKLIDPKYLPEGNDPLYDFAKLIHNYYGHFDLAMQYSSTYHFDVQIPSAPHLPAVFTEWFDDDAMGTEHHLGSLDEFSKDFHTFLSSQEVSFPFEANNIGWRYRLLFTHATLTAGLFPFIVKGDDDEFHAGILYERATALFYELLSMAYHTGLMEPFPEIKNKWKNILEKETQDPETYGRQIQELNQAIDKEFQKNEKRSEIRRGDEDTASEILNNLELEQPFNGQLPGDAEVYVAARRVGENVLTLEIETRKTYRQKAIRSVQAVMRTWRDFNEKGLQSLGEFISLPEEAFGPGEQAMVLAKELADFAESRMRQKQSQDQIFRALRVQTSESLTRSKLEKLLSRPMQYRREHIKEDRVLPAGIMQEYRPVIIFSENAQAANPGSFVIEIRHLHSLLSSGDLKPVESDLRQLAQRIHQHFPQYSRQKIQTQDQLVTVYPPQYIQSGTLEMSLWPDLEPGFESLKEKMTTDGASFVNLADRNIGNQGQESSSVDLKHKPGFSFFEQLKKMGRSKEKEPVSEPQKIQETEDMSERDASEEVDLASLPLRPEEGFSYEQIEAAIQMLQLLLADHPKAKEALESFYFIFNKHKTLDGLMPLNLPKNLIFAIQENIFSVRKDLLAGINPAVREDYEQALDLLEIIISTRSEIRTQEEGPKTEEAAAANLFKNAAKEGALALKRNIALVSMDWTLNALLEQSAKLLNQGESDVTEKDLESYGISLKSFFNDHFRKPHTLWRIALGYLRQNGPLESNRQKIDLWRKALQDLRQAASARSELRGSAHEHFIGELQHNGTVTMETGKKKPTVSVKLSVIKRVNSNANAEVPAQVIVQFDEKKFAHYHRDDFNFQGFDLRLEFTMSRPLVERPEALWKEVAERISENKNHIIGIYNSNDPVNEGYRKTIYDIVTGLSPIIPSVIPVRGRIFTYTLQSGQQVGVRDASFTAVLPYIDQNQEIPETLQKLTPRKATHHGEISLGFVHEQKAGKLKTRKLAYITMSEFKNQQVTPYIRKKGPGIYDLEIEVTSMATKKPFIVASYPFAKDGRIITDRPVLNRPRSSFPIVREIVDGILRDNFPKELRVIRESDFGRQAGLFKQKTVYFWPDDVRMEIWKGIKNPVLKIDPVIMTQNDIETKTWVASLWTSPTAEQPEIPLGSMILYQNGQFASGFQKSFPLIGYLRVRGEVPTARRYFGDVSKALWNIYWLANGGPLAPKPDIVNTNLNPKGYDTYLYHLNGETVQIYVWRGKDTQAGVTTRSWVSFEDGSRGVLYENSAVSQKRAFVLFRNNQFLDTPEETAQSVVGNITSPRSEIRSQDSADEAFAAAVENLVLEYPPDIQILHAIRDIFLRVLIDRNFRQVLRNLPETKITLEDLRKKIRDSAKHDARIYYDEPRLPRTAMENIALAQVFSNTNHDRLFYQYLSHLLARDADGRLENPGFVRLLATAGTGAVEYNLTPILDLKVQEQRLVLSESYLKNRTAEIEMAVQQLRNKTRDLIFKAENARNIFLRLVDHGFAAEVLKAMENNPDIQLYISPDEINRAEEMLGRRPFQSKVTAHLEKMPAGKAPSGFEVRVGDEIHFIVSITDLISILIFYGGDLSRVGPQSVMIDWDGSQTSRPRKGQFHIFKNSAGDIQKALKILTAEEVTIKKFSSKAMPPGWRVTTNVIGAQYLFTVGDLAAFLTAFGGTRAGSAIVRKNGDGARVLVKVPGIKNRIRVSLKDPESIEKIIMILWSRSELRQPDGIAPDYLKAAGKQGIKNIFLINEKDLSALSEAQKDELYKIVYMNRSEVRLVIYGSRMEDGQNRRDRALINLSNVFRIQDGGDTALERYNLPKSVAIHFSALSVNPKEEFSFSSRPRLKFFKLKKEVGVIAVALLYALNGQSLRGIVEKDGEINPASELIQSVQQQYLSHLVVAYAA